MTDDIYVDVRVRVRRDTYRALYAEAQRRRLDGAGELIAAMVHSGRVPRRSPAKRAEARPITRELGEAIVARVEAGELSVSRAARELNVTRAAVQYWQRKLRAEAEAEHAAHAAAMAELGVTGRPPVRNPAVPTEAGR